MQQSNIRMESENHLKNEVYPKSLFTNSGFYDWHTVNSLNMRKLFFMLVLSFVSTTVFSQRGYIFDQESCGNDCWSPVNFSLVILEDNRTVALMNLDKNLDIAIRCYNKIQNNSGILKGKGNVYQIFDNLTKEKIPFVAKEASKVEFTITLRPQGVVLMNIIVLGKSHILRGYDIRDIEKRRLEEERQQKELEYNTTIASAQRNFERNQYAQAIQDYRTALELKPAQANSINPRIREAERLEQQAREREQQARELEERYQNTITSAQRKFDQRQYTQAKQDYQAALQIKPEKAASINPKIAEIDRMLQFLNERKSKIYDYSTDFTSDYNTVNEKVLSEIRKVLFAESYLKSAKITINAVMDTSGIVSSSFTSTITSTRLNNKFQQIADNIQLKQPAMNGYTVSARAVFDYSLNASEATIIVKKDAKSIYSDYYEYDSKYKSSIDNTLSNAPMGKFTFQCNKVTINGVSFDQNKMLSYKGTGGPSNALLSLLVPGLGDHRVTGGTKKGIGKMLCTYGLVGAGIGAKFYSNYEYDKYHDATEQSAMDKSYDRANIANQAFFLCVGTGAIIWISDVIWVWSKGSKNKKEQEVWKRTNMSLYYIPEFQATGLTYTLNF